jgi:hypothetical protein
VREAVIELRARTPVRTDDRLVHQDIDYGLGELADRLVEGHGLDAVIDALRPLRADNNVAELLFFVFWINDRNMLTVFSEDEVVNAAFRFLLPFRDGATEMIDERELPGWGWDALWQHDYSSHRTDHLTDEQHFRLVVALIDRVPMDDKILWMIGDGPLSSASESAAYRQQIETLEKTNAKIARAIRLVGWRERVAAAQEEGKALWYLGHDDGGQSDEPDPTLT